MDLSIQDISYKKNHVTCDICVWLLPHGMMFSRSIYVVAGITLSFFLSAELYSIEWIYHLLFTHLSVDIFIVSTFSQLWIVLLWTFLSKFFYKHIFNSFGYISRIGMAGQYDNFMFNFWGTSKPFFKVAPLLYIPAIRKKCSNISTSSPTIIIVHLLDYSHPNIHKWRRQWHPTPVLLPGKSHGRRSLVGYSPWGH